MENSPLNLAHQQHRKAETHLRYRRFEEAIECHQKAADLLEEAIKNTTVQRALESLVLQKNFHLKQKDIIREKRRQYENYKKVVEYNQRRMAKAFATYEFINKKDEKKGLQVAIYKTMTEQDSLLDYLKRRGVGSDTDSMQSIESGEWDDKTISADIAELNDGSHVIGIKKPKDDQMVIEELQILNKQLQTLVCQLVMQLDASAQETEALRDRIKVLETEREKYVPHSEITVTTEAPTFQNNLRVLTDSVGGNSSPFVFSPCSELSPDAIEARELPALAPLEMPELDFTTLLHKSSISTLDSNKEA